MIKRIHQVLQHRSPLSGIELMSLASNHHFPRHAHDQFGVGVIDGGAQRSWSGIGQVEAGRGDVIMVNPGEIHDGIPIDNRIRKWRMIYFDPQLIKNELKAETHAPFEVIRPVTQDRLLSRHVERLFNVLAGCSTDRLALEENVVGTLIYALRRHGTHQLRDHSRPCVARALQRLDSAPEVPVSLCDLANLSNLSRFQFLRAFTGAIGITPHAYAIQRRARLAKQLLANGFALADAAARSGFADQSHMTRAFVRQFGVTPRRYQAAVV
jgi:AraC-like DNA-binding protein